MLVQKIIRTICTVIIAGREDLSTLHDSDCSLAVLALSDENVRTVDGGLIVGRNSQFVPVKNL